MRKRYRFLLGFIVATVIHGCAVESPKKVVLANVFSPQIETGGNDLGSEIHGDLRQPLGSDIAAGKSDAAVDVSDLRQLQQSASQGNSAAQFKLGQLFSEGRGVAQNEDEARKWFLLAAQAGRPDAQYALGRAYMRPDRGVIDYASAAKWYRLASDQGFALAQLHLGWMYVNGWGVPTDVNKAFILFQAAEAAGIPDAQKAVIYAYKFADHDIQERLGLHAAAEAGSVQAQRRLAQMFDARDESATTHTNEAIKWYRLAAEQGDLEAQRALGRLLRNRDPHEALKWYTLAAEREDVPSQLALGTLFLQGPIEFRDYKLVMNWYRRAAQNGNREARTSLAEMFKKGQGSSPNLVATYALHFTAIMFDQDIEYQLSRFHPLVEDAMSTVEIGAGKKLVREMLKPGSYLKALDEVAGQ